MRLTPVFPWDAVGFVADGKELKIYYGTSDASIFPGRAGINQLMQF
jgi:predicted GH43/DUF377 family glycosyl hydrolase